MVTAVQRKKFSWVMLAMFAASAMFLIPAGFAAEEGEVVQGAASLGEGIKAFGLAIGAGLAVGLAGMATAKAQAAVGAGGTGAMAEKPELFTNVLILFAIPETIVVLGFVIAFFLYGSI